jgi:hypothetical protein
LQCIAHEMDMRVVPIDDRAVHPNFIGFFHPLARSPIGRFPFHHCLAADRDRENAALVPARLDAVRGGGGSHLRTGLRSIIPCKVGKEQGIWRKRADFMKTGRQSRNDFNALRLISLLKLSGNFSRLAGKQQGIIFDQLGRCASAVIDG